MGINEYEKIVPAVPNYRDEAVPEEVAFTWEAGLHNPGEQGKYKVEFLSVLNPATVETAPTKVERLLELDDRARWDAETQPGFNYYYADTAVNGVARSFCLWDSAEDARRASERPAHQLAVAYAMGEGKDVYETYRVAKTRITRTEAGLYFAKFACMVVKNGEIASFWHCGEAA